MRHYIVLNTNYNHTTSMVGDLAYTYVKLKNIVLFLFYFFVLFCLFFSIIDDFIATNVYFVFVVASQQVTASTIKTGSARRNAPLCEPHTQQRKTILYYSIVPQWDP